jgi:hypothetical protein
MVGEIYRGHQVSMNGAAALEETKLPDHEAWVGLARNRTREASFADYKPFGDDGIVLASGPFPAIHQGLSIL